MKFVTVRDLRGRSGDLWRRLEAERELVVTSNGRPMAILSVVGGDDAEETLRAVRRARGMQALSALQRRSVERGANRLTPRAIEAEIRAVRRKRHR